MYRRRTCRHCRKGFTPEFPNQQAHIECRPLRRRKLSRVYQRDYQRRLRAEFKRSWEDIAADGP